MSGRSRVLIKNVLYSYFSEIWFLLLMFVTTPYIVNRLGVESYGILSMISVLVGYLTFMEMGFGDSIVKYVAEYTAQKNNQMISKIVGNALCVFFVVGFVGAFLIVISNKIIVHHILNISPSLIHTARMVFYIMAAGFFFTMITNAFAAIPKALQRFDISNKMIIGIGTTQTLLTVFLLYIGKDLKAVVLLNLFVTIISLFLYRTVSSRLLSFKSLRPAFERKTFSKMFTFGSYIAISNITAKVAVYTNQLFIGIFLPVAYVSYYVIPQSLAFKLWVIPSAITRVLFPAFSELHGLNDKEKIQKLYLRATKYIVILVTPPMILMVLFARKFLTLWIGEEFSVNGSIVFQLLAFSVWISSCAWVAMVTARSLGRADFPAKLNTFQAVLNLVLCMVLIPLWGIKGAAFSWAIHHVIAIPILIVWTTKRLVHIPVRLYFWKGYIQPILISCFLTLPVYLIKDFVGFNSLFLLLGSCLMVYLLNLCISYLLLFHKDEKQSMWGFLVQERL